MESTPRIRARGAYKKSAVSRRQVLDAAVRSLAERGYARTSVNDIARAAGMSKGAVHYHFDSKDDLVARVLEHCAAIARERLRLAWDAPGEPAEKIRRAVREMRDIRKQGVPEIRVLADLTAQGLSDPRLRKVLARLYETNRQEIVAYLSHSLEELGVEPKVPVHVIPRLFVGIVDGMALQDFFDPPSREDARSIEQALERFALSLFEI